MSPKCVVDIPLLVQDLQKSARPNRKTRELHELIHGETELLQMEMKKIGKLDKHIPGEIYKAKKMNLQRRLGVLVRSVVMFRSLCGCSRLSVVPRSLRSLNRQTCRFFGISPSVIRKVPEGRSGCVDFCCDYMEPFAEAVNSIIRSDEDLSLEPQIGDLPQDVLCLILPQLNLADLVRSRSVCSSFRKVRSGNFPGPSSRSAVSFSLQL